MSLAGSNGKSGAAASREISLACQQTMQARIRVRDRHGSCPKQTVVLTIQFSSMEHHAFHVPYLLDTTPEAAFYGQAVKTVAYLRVSTTQQVLGPEARTPEGLAGRLTARWQGGRNPALPRTGRFQDRHRQVWACPVPPSTAHEHPRAQAEPLACVGSGTGAVARQDLACLYPGFPPACPSSRVRGSVSSSRHFVRSMRISLTARSCTFRDKIYGTYLVGAAFAIGYSTASDRSLGTTPRPFSLPLAV